MPASPSILHRLACAAALALGATPASARELVPASEGATPVQVMVLGTYHFDNPGRDVVTMEADDVLAPDRQRELEAVARALSIYAPTIVAVERVSDAADLSLPEYTHFAPAMLARKRSETYQVGYRIAAGLGHEKVYGFDGGGWRPFSIA